MSFKFHRGKYGFSSGEVECQSFSLKPGAVLCIVDDGLSSIAELLLLFSGLREQVQQALTPKVDGIVRERPELEANMIASSALNGTALLELTVAERAKKVGFVFQNPSKSFVCRSAFEEFCFSLMAAGYELPHIYRLRPYGLYEVRNSRPERLSGGEQQRLNCAALMEQKLELVVADFFSSNLDSGFVADFLDWVETACHEGMIAILRVPAYFPRKEGWVQAIAEKGKFKLVSDGGHVSPREKPVIAPRSVARDSIVLETHSLETAYAKMPLSVRLHQGEVLILKGPNGAGKTTFLRAITGDEKIVSGNIDIDRKLVAPVVSYQYPNSALLALKVADLNLSEAHVNLIGLGPEVMQRRIIELQYTYQKRIDVLVAADQSEGIVLLDEPTTGLGNRATHFLAQVIDLYPEKSFLIVTHDEGLSEFGAQIDMEKL